MAVRTKRLIVYAFIAVIIGIAWSLLLYHKEDDVTKSLTARVKYDDFILSVKTIGKLETNRTKEILEPSGLQSTYFYSNLTLKHPVPKDIVVDFSTFLANIDDRTPLVNKIKN